jgi:hypothetical protein
MNRASPVSKLVNQANRVLLSGNIQWLTSSLLRTYSSKVSKDWPSDPENDSEFGSLMVLLRVDLYESSD